MNIKIRKLTPNLVDDYVRFFDTTSHADNKAEHKCYCVWWCNDEYEGKDFTSSVDIRRDYAIQYVIGSNIQGYLAYCDDQVVGWCNANTKADCLKCYCWRRFMGFVPTEESQSDIKVKSVFCFAIAPEMRRKGIAKLLLARVCKDAAQDGFNYVEAYPNKAFANEAEDYMGPFEIYERTGFSVYFETGRQIVMRKNLQSSQTVL
jgi:GNAT superfamily N-acetyltransferase